MTEDNISAHDPTDQSSGAAVDRPLFAKVVKFVFKTTLGTTIITVSLAGAIAPDKAVLPFWATPLPEWKHEFAIDRNVTLEFDTVPGSAAASMVTSLIPFRV